MRSAARALIVATSLALPLGGCETMNFDPIDWLAGDWFGTKKPLPGERRPVFPEGVPGVGRGVPAEYRKDGQLAEQLAAEQEAAAAAQQAAIREEEAKAKPKPKPKARPKPKPKPAVAQSQPEPEPQRQAAPPPRQAPQVQWPEPGQPSRPAPQQQIQWPDPPPAR